MVDESAPTAATTPPPIHVLLVEDDDNYVALLKHRVSDDIVLTAVASLGEAFVARGDFDLTLLDLTLRDAPGGVDTVRAAKGRVPEPIVVLTGLDDFDGMYAREAKAAGATEWASKDIEPHLLVRILRVASACSRLSRSWSPSHD